MISDRIKFLREKAGYSQAQLAKKLDVTRSSVNAWEMDLSTPTSQYVVAMARLFHVSTDYLLGLDLFCEATGCTDGEHAQEMLNKAGGNLTAAALMEMSGCTSEEAFAAMEKTFSFYEALKMLS